MYSLHDAPLPHARSRTKMYDIKDDYVERYLTGGESLYDLADEEGKVYLDRVPIPDHSVR